MVEKMIVDHGIDRRRVFVTGLSAGGAMTSVMLATYPDAFAAGAIIAGLPYGTATNVNEAFESMGQVRAPARRANGAISCVPRRHTRVRGRAYRCGTATPIRW
jgi:poly(hydroxyalkanoate) depolymerase family esterase